MGVMTEGFADRFRERDPESSDTYDRFLAKQQARLKRAASGNIVIKRDAMLLETSRQGFLRWYLNSQEDPDDVTSASAAQDWDVFVHEVRTQSGMHRHQGGLVIYVISGVGYTIVENRRLDWKAGDLLLLPVMPGGVAHQHFNLDSKPSEWIAFIYRPMHNAVGSYVEQVTAAPDFQ